MLIAAFVTLGFAVLVGSILAIMYLHTKGAAPPWPLPALHALLAIGGFVCLLFALRGPPRGLETGTGSFGVIAAVLIATAALIGGGIIAVHLLGRRLPEILIGFHATFAVGGFIILAAYLFAG